MRKVLRCLLLYLYVYCIRWPDYQILTRVERTAQWVQRMTGYDCLDQARFCWIIAGASQLVTVFSLAGMPWWLGLFCWALTLGVAVFYIRGALKHQPMDAWVRDMAAQGYANYRKTFMPGVRFSMALIVVFWTVTPISFVNTRIFLIAAVVGMYLQCCDPLPPCKGRIREWWASRHLVPVPLPQTR